MAKTKTSVKKATPIRLPHDGPIHLACLEKTKRNQTDDLPIVQRAAEILSNKDGRIDHAAMMQHLSLGEGVASEHVSSPRDTPQRLLQLIQSLQQAQKIQEQLRLVRTFKSSWIQQRSNSLTDDPLATTTATTASTDPLLAPVVYRILLEWMLSAQTPVTLRRALQSMLVIFLEEKNTKWVDAIHRDVLESLWNDLKMNKTVANNSTNSGRAWTDACQATEVIMQWGPFQATCNRHPTLLTETLQVLQERALSLTSFLLTRKEDPSNTAASVAVAQEDVWDQDCTRKVRECLALTHLVKIIYALDVVPESSLSSLKNFLWELIRCRAVPADQLSVVCIVYGRTLVLSSNNITATNDEHDVSSILQSVSSSAQALSDLHRASLLQGLAATLPWNDQLICKGRDMRDQPLYALLTSFETLALESVDPDVRLTALKGIRSLVSRCHQPLDQNKDEAQQQQHYELNDKAFVSDMTNRILQVVLQLWENPPTRRLASGISALFQTLVHWMQDLDLEEKGNSSLFDSIVQTLLAQPPNRKGRYLALEMLLPVAGAQAMLQGEILTDLLIGVMDQGHNTGAIADLWVRMLQQLLAEMTKEEKTNAILPQAWLQTWVPSLAKELIAERKLTCRKQLISFCLPRLISSTPNRAHTAQSFTALLLEINYHVADNDLSVTMCEDSLKDRILWAQLEVARQASSLLRPSKTSSDMSTADNSSKELRSLVATSIPLEKLREALTHVSSVIRVAALQSMGPVVQCYVGTDEPLKVMRREMKLFRYMLPFAVKTEGREYVALVLECLLSLTDRCMATEAASLSDSCISPSLLLPETLSFVKDFLVGDMLKILGYPGSPADKETFLLSMIECLALFSAREFNVDLDSKLLPKNGSIWLRRRRPIEEETMMQVRIAILGPEVFSALLSVLRSSIWDSARSSAYRLISSLLSLSQQASLQIPSDFRTPESRRQIAGWASNAASSPRQREADSGSGLLAILCHSFLDMREDKLMFVTQLVDDLEDNLVKMKELLSDILADSIDFSAGTSLPLAHGTIQALRLVLENDSLFKGEIDERLDALMSRMARIFNNSIQISLSVVADIRAGGVLEGMESTIISGDAPGTPGKADTKVNPGAIGANGIFSSISRVTKEENRKRLASQRIVMGSWLLTKETCAAIAAVIAVEKYAVPLSIVDRTGMLLISTLASLKHTGAAYAAHRALQQIAERCLADSETHSLTQLPSQWTERLLSEVSDLDRVVRDSTLRRSTGYALGFLSVMRSEVLTRSRPQPLCDRVLSSVIRLSLPPQGRLRSFADTVGVDIANTFSFMNESFIDTPSADSEYELRSRIHALNVLRMIILDAPLAREVFPVIGDAITTSLIGYTDPEWAVRNSATMVFAAVMLRSVDADKNASNFYATSGNATGAAELFRSYPVLQTFLLAVLRGSIAGLLSANTNMSLPPVLPILLLLARIQPVALSDPDTVVLVEPFLPHIIQCLEHEELVIRKASARALCNLSSRVQNSSTYIGKLANLLRLRLDDAVQGMDSSASYNWNRLHGTLLAADVMAKSTEDSKQILREIFGNHAFFTRWFKNKRIAIPPTCILASISVLSGLDDHHNFVLERCSEVIVWFEQEQVHHAGSGELATTSARVASQALSRKLWSGNLSPENFETILLKLLGLFHSERIDVRIASVKSFKKSIYDGLDEHVKLSTKEREYCIGLFTSLAGMLTEALVLELARAKKEEEPHPPSLRRLSRCLLECFEAASRIGSLEQALAPVKGNILAITNQLVETGRALDDDCVTSLLGNATELWSYVVDNASDCANVQVLLNKISQPSCHWRVRHSAARALERIRVFSPNLSLRIRLAQDGEEDVRVAASASSVVPEMALASAFGENLAQSMEFALDEVLRMSGDLEEKIVAHGTNELDDKDRKIFVPENPNSYCEPSLSFQLALAAVLQGDSFLTLSDDCLPKSKILLERCQKVLTALMIQLSATTENHSSALHITRSAGIFVALHSLLLASCTCILLVSDQRPSFDAQALAEELLSSLLSCRSSSKEAAHPCVRDVLLALQQAEFHSQETKDSLMHCCFLASQLCSE